MSAIVAAFSLATLGWLLGRLHWRWAPAFSLVANIVIRVAAALLLFNEVPHGIARGGAWVVAGAAVALVGLALVATAGAYSVALVLFVRDPDGGD